MNSIIPATRNSSNPNAALPATSFASIEAFRKYGVSRNLVHHMMLNNFNFPAQFTDCLANYYILHWTCDYFRGKLTDGTIRLFDVKQNKEVEYIVIFRNSLRVTFAGTKVKLSMRSAQPEFDLPSYILVEPYV